MTLTEPYRASRDGHVPAYVRGWLAAYLAGRQPEDAPPPRHVVALLWCCTDVMPPVLCDALGVEHGTTYGRGVRHLVAG